MALVRMAEVRIDPARMADYRALLGEEIRVSLAVEPGVLMLAAVALRDRPDWIRITEVYADETAYQAHLRTPHFLAYKTGVAEMVLELVLLEADAVAIGVKPGAF